MDDALPKTAEDYYTYRINNFHPFLDNIITINILKVRFEEVYTGQWTPSMKKCKSDKWTNKYLSRPSSWTRRISRAVIQTIIMSILSQSQSFL